MYYSAGTYEAFAHPEKPKDVDKKSAYIIGTGLAGLTAAFYLVPVSYTHLDVYKRQVSPRGAWSAPGTGPQADHPIFPPCPKA